MSKILGRGRGKDKMVMKRLENKLELEFSGGGTKRHFSLPLLDDAGGGQREPKVEHDAVVKIMGGEFKEMLRDVALVSSHLTLEAKEGEFVVSAKGDSAEMRAVSEKDERKGFEVKAKKEAHSTFPLQYLDDIAKACPDDAQMEIHLRTNAPVKLDYKIGKASLVYTSLPG